MTFHIPQLPLFQTGVLILLLLVPIISTYRSYKSAPKKSHLWAFLGLAVLLTGISLVIAESRGGLPIGMGHGWPKDFLTLRGEGGHFNSLYFVIDIVFYFIVIVWVDAIKKLFISRQRLLAIGWIIIAVIVCAAAVRSSYSKPLDSHIVPTSIETTSMKIHSQTSCEYLVALQSEKLNQLLEISADKVYRGKIATLDFTQFPEA